MDLCDQQYWFLIMKLSKGETSSWRDIMNNPLLSNSLPMSIALEEEGATEGAPEGVQGAPEEIQQSNDKEQTIVG